MSDVNLQPYIGPMPPMNTASEDQTKVGSPPGSHWVYSFILRFLWYSASLCLVLSAMSSYESNTNSPDRWWAAVPLTLGAPGSLFLAIRSLMQLRAFARRLRHRCVHCRADVQGIIGDECPACRHSAYSIR